ncbi:DUF262 domain-containing protein [Clostridium sp. MCC344]|nr:DUF262 domain-containing protein [Clostridium sp. MCC344]
MCYRRRKTVMPDHYEMQDEETSVISYDISVIPNDFNVMTINSLIESGIISMPTFQRNYVWDRKRASRFIESLILGLPIPQIFLYQIERNKYSIIDGQQRLLTIYFFAKQRFPRSGKRTVLRKIFDENGKIPDNILSDNELFQDFKLQFAKQENGEPHPLNNKKYHTLDVAQKSSFDLMPIRCMSIRQNKPEDNGSIYEIFSRLNTGGLNLSPQEIRGCLYRSDFYKMIYALNSEACWRNMVGKKEEDDKFRDVEVLLRSYALLYDEALYSGSMIRFLNRFSKEAQAFDEEKIEQSKNIFFDFMRICEDIDKKDFLTKTGSFNVSLFDAVFVTIAERILSDGIENASITQAAFNELKDDEDFKTAITHSTSHVESVKTRLRLARKYLYGIELPNDED